MTYRHKKCGKFMEKKEDTARDWFVCYHCMMSTDDRTKVEKV